MPLPRGIAVKVIGTLKPRSIAAGLSVSRTYNYAAECAGERSILRAWEGTYCGGFCR